MSRKNKNRKKRNRISIGGIFFRTFLLTFGLVILAGLVGIAAFQWIVEPARARETSHFQVTGGMVGNDDAALQTEQSTEQIQEQIEEIKDVNDK